MNEQVNIEKKLTKSFLRLLQSQQLCRCLRYLLL